MCQKRILNAKLCTHSNAQLNRLIYFRYTKNATNSECGSAYTLINVEGLYVQKYDMYHHHVFLGNRKWQNKNNV